VESRYLTRTREDLDYRAERLCEVWPHRFPTLASATPFAHNPTALAEKVYGGRMGNVHPGDGAKYPGRGLIMCTGAEAYRLVGEALGFDLLAHPEKLEEKACALAASVAWWEKRIPDNVIGNVQRETLAVNGGALALSERIATTGIAHRALV
jgi:putative chitinase